MFVLTLVRETRGNSEVENMLLFASQERRRAVQSEINRYCAVRQSTQPKS